MGHLPKKNYRLGGVEAAIWENKNDKGTYYSFSFSKNYKTQDGEWKTTGSHGFQYGATLQFIVTSNVTDTRGNRLVGKGLSEPSDFVLMFKIEEKKPKSDSDPDGSIPFPQTSVIILVILAGAGISACRRFKFR